MDADAGKAKRRGSSGSPPSTTEASDPTCLANEGDGRPTRPSPSKQGSGSGRIVVELSEAQVDQVVREAGHGGAMSVLLSAVTGPDWALAFDTGRGPLAQLEDRRLSRSLLLGLMVLSCVAVAETDMSISDVARMSRLENSTTHRYMSTLLAVGLLEQDPSSRRYRLAGA